MPNVTNGVANIYFHKYPLATMSSQGYSNSDAIKIMSVNNPITYQIKWGQTNSRITNFMTKDEYVSGDVANVIFDIYMGNVWREHDNNISNMAFIGSLRKSRDMPLIMGEGMNPQFTTGVNLKDWHSFTVDIAPVVKSYLSYTLTPFMKGSPSELFNMGGTYNTNNSYDFTSIGGSDRIIQVQARFEVYEQDATISEKLVIATSGGSEVFKNTGGIVVVNAALQHDEKPILHRYNINCNPTTTYKEFFSNFPNNDSTGGEKRVQIFKKVRLDDEGEFLSWFQEKFANSGTPNHAYNMTDFYVQIYTDESDGTHHTVKLRDVQYTLGNTATPTSGWWSTGWGTNSDPHDTEVMKVLSQNVSPAYINSVTAGTITSDTISYRVRLGCSGSTLGTNVAVSESRYYVLDHETPNTAYDYVRFHWLNRLGGIDSYTAKRDISESVNVSKVFFERQSPNRQFIQQYNGTSNPFSNPQDALGGDSYKSSVNTLAVEATRSKTVYTEPLNMEESKWLEEILTSPNVWVELDNEAGFWTEFVTNNSAEIHPSTRDYFPVTITNSSLTTVDQALGLVKFNLEYTMANSIVTQSN